MTLDDKIIKAILSDKCKVAINQIRREMTITLCDEVTRQKTEIVLERYTPCSLATITVFQGVDVLFKIDRLPVSDTLCWLVESIAQDRQKPGNDTSAQNYKKALDHLSSLGA